MCTAECRHANATKKLLTRVVVGCRCRAEGLSISSVCDPRSLSVCLSVSLSLLSLSLSLALPLCLSLSFSYVRSFSFSYARFVPSFRFVRSFVRSFLFSRRLFLSFVRSFVRSSDSAYAERDVDHFKDDDRADRSSRWIAVVTPTRRCLSLSIAIYLPSYFALFPLSPLLADSSSFPCSSAAESLKPHCVTVVGRDRGFSNLLVRTREPSI